jgi:predicted protein tyrosine phosphatase
MDPLLDDSVDFIHKLRRVRSVDAEIIIRKLTRISTNSAVEISDNEVNLDCGSLYLTFQIFN